MGEEIKGMLYTSRTLPPGVHHEWLEGYTKSDWKGSIPKPVRLLI